MLYMELTAYFSRIKGSLYYNQSSAPLSRIPEYLTTSAGDLGHKSMGYHVYFFRLLPYPLTSPNSF